MRFHEYLEKAGACDKGREWVGRHGLKWAWNNCERPGWLVWLIWRGDWDVWNESDEGIFPRVEKRFLSLRRQMWWYSDSRRNVAACNYIRKHVKLGKLSDLTSQYEG